MAKLVVDFQDGFQRDTIVLRLNDTDIFRETAVTTTLMLGLATTFDTTLPPQHVNLEVIVPTRNLAERFGIDISSDTYVGINIEADNLRWQVSQEPFWYA